MEELIRTAKSALGLVLLIILGRIMYDMIKSAYRNKRVPQWGLLGMLLTLMSTVVMMLIVSYELDIPMWLHMWHIINISAYVITLYSIALEVRKE